MAAPDVPDRVLAVFLCAAWCQTCGEFRATFERLARADPASRFVWLDVEDDSALIGELDIENFPTLAVFRTAVPLFYGVTLPQEGVVARTLAALKDDERAPIEVPAEIAALPAALAARSGRT